MSLPRTGRRICDDDELFLLCKTLLLRRLLLLLLLLSPAPPVFVVPETVDVDGAADSRFDLDDLAPRVLGDLPLLTFAPGRSSRGTYPGG
jgi:hypothetical protein